MKTAKFEQFVKEAGAIITPTNEVIDNSIETLATQLAEYATKSDLKTFVIGISGGLDSAVTAAIAAISAKKCGVKVIGVSIPLSSSVAHKEQAKWVGETYCDSFMEMSSWEEDNFEIDKTPHQMVDYAVSTLDRVIAKAGFDTYTLDYRVAQGNVKARLRMISLYHIAGLTGGMVLSTDNMTEKWCGFWTICGDVGDYSPIQYVEKYWEEIPMARALGVREDIITQPPSDGLGVTDANTDEFQLGITYRELGPVMFACENMLPENLQAMFEEVKDLPQIQNVIARNKRTEFKRVGTIEIERETNGFPKNFK